MFKSFLKDETGAELAEYCVGIALLVAIAVIAYQVIGDAILDKNDGTATKITDATFSRTSP